MAEVAISVRHLAELYHMSRTRFEVDPNSSPDSTSEEAIEACLEALESPQLAPGLARGARTVERGDELYGCDWRTSENECPNCAYPREEEGRSRVGMKEKIARAQSGLKAELSKSCPRGPHGECDRCVSEDSAERPEGDASCGEEEEE